MATPSVEIQKLACFDARVFQKKPKFLVEKSALNVTSQIFSSIAATSSQQTFQVLVPSTSTFVDRDVFWHSDIFMSADVVLPAANYAAGLPNSQSPIAVYGIDFNVAAFPLHKLLGTAVAQINDAAVQVNMPDVLPALLHLKDTLKNRQLSTCPTQLDRYRFASDGAGSINTQVNDYSFTSLESDSPNGAGFFEWTNPLGQPLTANYINPVNGQTINVVNGVPCAPILDLTGETLINRTMRVFFRIRSTELLMLSPFIFQNQYCDAEVGLTGIQNMQFTFNISSSAVARLLRTSQQNASGSPTTGTRLFSNILLNTSTSNGSPFQNAQLQMRFLTPPLSLSLPAASVVPMMDYPRYPSNIVTVPAAQTVTISTNTIQLNQIPDYFIVYVKPLNFAGRCVYRNTVGATVTDRGLYGNIVCQPTDIGDFMLPIRGIRVQFNNRQSLLGTESQERLFEMSKLNGVDRVNYVEWIGRGQMGRFAGRHVPLTGAPLVFRPKDLGLDDSMAPGTVGQFTLQIQMEVENTSPLPIVNSTPTTDNDVQCQAIIITANSKFIISRAGTSQIVSGVSEAEVLAAPLFEDAPTIADMSRMVGRGALESIGSAVSKLRDLFSTGKSVADAVKGISKLSGTHTGRRVADTLESVGMGSAGAGRAGAGSAGAGRAGAGRDLESRLM